MTIAFGSLKKNQETDNTGHEIERETNQNYDTIKAHSEQVATVALPQCSEKFR